MSVLDKFFAILDKYLPPEQRIQKSQSIEESVEEIFGHTSMEEMAREQLSQVDLALLIIHNIIMPAFLNETSINESFDQFSDAVNNEQVLKLTTYWLSQMLTDAITNLAEQHHTAPEKLFMTAMQGYRQAVLAMSTKMASPVADTP